MVRAPLDVFIASSRADKEHQRALEERLAVLVRGGLVSPARSGLIGSGEPWQAATAAHFDTAQLILLLMSEDTLTGDPYSREMARALGSHEAREALVIPILVHPCPWESTPLGRLAPLPSAGRPIAAWADAGAAWAEVERAVQAAVEELGAARGRAETPALWPAERGRAAKYRMTCPETRHLFRTTGAPQPALQTARSLGRYRLLRVIRGGARGSVWAAIDEETAREVILEVITEPALFVLLQRKARTFGALRHKNLAVIDGGQTDAGAPFVVLQLLTGESLADLLARTRRLEPTAAAGIGRDVAQALAAVHAVQIVHRDLKPANIFLHREPDEDATVVKVLEVGLTAYLEVFRDPGVAMGTPAYLSPEQICADTALDHRRMDIWALGVVMFEMLTGVCPFRAPTVIATLSEIAHGEIPSVDSVVKGIDPALVQVVDRCMRRSPDERFQSAAEVAAELARFAGWR